jgi:hypothetical protein
VLEEDRVAAERRIEEADPERALEPDERDRDRDDGVPRIMMSDVA